MSVWELRTRIQQHSVNCGGQGFSLSFSLPSRYSTQDIALVLQHEWIVVTRVFVCVFNCDPCTPPPSLPTAGPGTLRQSVYEAFLDRDDTFRLIDGAAKSSNLGDAATLRAHTISARDALLAASGWTERDGVYEDIAFSPGRHSQFCDVSKMDPAACKAYAAIVADAVRTCPDEHFTGTCEGMHAKVAPCQCADSDACEGCNAFNLDHATRRDIPMVEDVAHPVHQLTNGRVSHDTARVLLPNVHPGVNALGAGAGPKEYYPCSGRLQSANYGGMKVLWCLTQGMDVLWIPMNAR